MCIYIYIYTPPKAQHFVYDCPCARSVNDRTRLLCLVCSPPRVRTTGTHRIANIDNLCILMKSYRRFICELCWITTLMSIYRRFICELCWSKHGVNSIASCFSIRPGPLPLPKVSMYLPKATFTGKGLYYSYETCEGKDYIYIYIYILLLLLLLMIYMYIYIYTYIIHTHTNT